MLPLVCVDVDGTLVGSAGSPSAGVWAAAERAIGRGQHVALCTARGFFGVTRDYAERLDPAGWHVCHSGAAVVNTAGVAPLVAALSPAIVKACEELAREAGWVLEHYTVGAYAVDSDAPLAVDHAGLIGVPFHRRDPAELVGEIVRAQFVVWESDVDAVLAGLPAGVTGSVATSPIMPGAAFVSITRRNVSKATGIARLAERLGVPMDRVMMVGDGHNDVEAMGAVGHGVAMGNAHPVCRAAARHHVGDVDRDGLAEALELSAGL